MLMFYDDVDFLFTLMLTDDQPFEESGQPRIHD